MRLSRCSSTVLAIALASSVALTAQPPQDPQDPQDPPSTPAPSLSPQAGTYDHFRLLQRADVTEMTVAGGVRYADPAGGFDLRCDAALLVLDRHEAVAAIREFGSRDGLPRRGPELPPARRSYGEHTMRARLASFLAALRTDAPAIPDLDLDLELLRSIYLEGDVSVVLDGVEVLRADSAYFSAIDDRIVLRGVTLRLRDVDATGRALQVTLRCDELVRQAGRFVGRDVSVTTDSAGVPQFEILSGEVEIVEHAAAFEINLRDSSLALSRTKLLPLPDQTFFTDRQHPFPIKSASAGYSGREGGKAEVVVGSDFNRLGGKLHEWLTGRPGDEFRGDWQLGVGWNEARGFPLESELRYRGGESYFGDALGFWLDDDGENIRDIRFNIDRTPIDQRSRHVLHTENRLHFGDRTKLDVTIFDASDAAVWSEFYSDRYYNDERPETNLYATHRADTWLATVSGRWNLTDFSYADGRQLDDRFVEELPYATFDWYSQPLLQLPGETPLLLSTSTSVAQLRSNYDDRIVSPVDDETWRIDNEVELAAPFVIGDFAVRPYADARLTHFDNTVDGESDERFAFGAGVEIGTRMSRVWNWFDVDGNDVALRHVVSPTLRFDHRYQVDGDPSDRYQFDAVDAIDEGARIRVGLLQRFQQRTRGSDGESESRELLWVDLAQNFTPIADRDNAGHGLGLFEYELLLRRQKISEQVEFGFGSEGEHDWNANELRTFNNFVEVKTAGVVWTGQYRADRTARGQVGYGISVPIRGRWRLAGHSLYDLEQDRSVQHLARLMREDRNWRLIVALRYDVVSDDTSLTFEFEPRLGGLFRPRRRSDWVIDGTMLGEDQPLAY